MLWRLVPDGESDLSRADQGRGRCGAQQRANKGSPVAWMAHKSVRTEIPAVLLSDELLRLLRN